MERAHFEAYLEKAIPSYADDQVQAGNWHPSDAVNRARQAYAALLPDGLASDKQHLFSALDGESGARVGMIWFMVNEQAARPTAFVCDLLVYEPYRRLGYGTQTMEALEGKVRELGLERIALHVFAHNAPARALYAKLGYQATNIQMAKELGT
jgi:GNAT superfamily N-acetyltransferase